LMQAPKNGYFYVIDRKTGKFISGNNYVNVTWATGLDANGRPLFVKEAFYVTEPAQVAPTPVGGHNWYPMSYSPLTNLVYIPALEQSSKYSPDPNFKVNPKGWNIGIGFSSAPVNPSTAEAAAKSKAGPHLLAWNPITQTEAWRVQYSRPGNGGVLSTAGNLVIQGSADGYLNAYRADTGTKLWSYVTQNAVMSGPATFELDGQQYIAVMAGIGGVAVGAGGPGALPRAKYGRMLAFKLGATASLPPLGDSASTREVPNLSRAAPMGDAAKGRFDYERVCASCHGANAVSPTAIPDLRFSPTISRVEGFNSIVIDGARKDKGMVSFASVLKPDEVENIRSYIIQQANVVLNTGGR
ncbi:MAG TPA: c-type cytochrome, partial [Steroidobacteraceae bacterium]|nr:c-type cytochrome [Steroidobacteraceae bacterium]